MNIVGLTGRLVRDPEIRTVGEKKSKICDFTIALDEFTRGSRTSVFPDCQAWSGQAEFLEKWCKKGTKLEITGRIRTSNYTNKDGNKVFRQYVLVDSITFAESKNATPPDDRMMDNPQTDLPTTSNTRTAEPKTVHEKATPNVAVQNPQTPPVDEDFMNIPNGMDSEVPF